MKRSPRNRRIDSLSVFFGALPFAFSLFRAIRTGYDLRYLWVALASLLGATAVMAVGRSSSRGQNAAIALSAGVFFIATVFAVLAALLLGTTMGGILVVASAFGFCFAAGCGLHVLARS